MKAAGRERKRRGLFPKQEVTLQLTLLLHGFLYFRAFLLVALKGIAKVNLVCFSLLSKEKNFFKVRYIGTF